jgi:hypothetical protein
MSSHRAVYIICSYHVGETVKHPDGWHQVPVNFPHELLLLICLLFERCCNELQVWFIVYNGFLVVHGILLGVGSGKIADCFGLVFPECAVGMIRCHYALGIGRMLIEGIVVQRAARNGLDPDVRSADHSLYRLTFYHRQHISMPCYRVSAP